MDTRNTAKANQRKGILKVWILCFVLAIGIFFVTYSILKFFVDFPEEGVTPSSASFVVAQTVSDEQSGELPISVPHEVEHDTSTVPYSLTDFAESVRTDHTAQQGELELFTPEKAAAIIGNLQAETEAGAVQEGSEEESVSLVGITIYASSAVVMLLAVVLVVLRIFQSIQFSKEIEALTPPPTGGFPAALAKPAHPAATKPARVSTTSLETQWNIVEERYEQLAATITSYETDLLLAIKYPAMNDVSEPATATMLKTLQKTEDMMTLYERSRGTATHEMVERFTDLVTDLEHHIHAAEQSAKRVAHSTLSEDDKKDFQQAQLLLTHVMDEGNPEQLRHDYLQKLRSTIERVNNRHTKDVIPENLMRAVEQRYRPALV